MTEVKKTRGLKGMIHGLDSFISGITEKGLELAEGSKFIQQHKSSETYKAIKSARQMYAEYNERLASGETRTLTGKAARALGKVAYGVKEDAKSKIGSLLGRIAGPIKRQGAKFAMAAVKNTLER